MESARLLQVGRQPREVEVEAVRLGEVHQAERDDVPVGEDPGQPPRVEAMGMVLQSPRFDVFALGLADGRVIGRLVSEPSVPCPGPGEAHQAEDREDRAPAHDHQQGADQHRRQAAAEVCAGEEDPLRGAAFGCREPAGDDLRCVRERAGLAHAEQEPDQEQRRVVERRRRRDREARPPDYDPRQDPPGADPVAPGPGRHLEQRVRERERAEDEAHLDRAQPEVRLDLAARPGDADAIQVGHPRQRDGERQHLEPHPGHRRLVGERGEVVDLVRGGHPQAIMGEHRLADGRRVS